VNESNPVSPAALAAVGEFEKEYGDIGLCISHGDYSSTHYSISGMKDWLLAALARVEAEARREAAATIEKKLTELTRRPYDGNSLPSACDHYCIAAESWAEIIRFEDGLRQAYADAIATLTPPTGGRE
jgi:hypothetical protein